MLFLKIIELEEDITRRTPGTRAKTEAEFTSASSVKSDQMLQVVCNQRDRFKAMVADLETVLTCDVVMCVIEAFNFFLLENTKFRKAN